MTNASTNNHILIVDDDDVLQTFLSDYLSTEGYHVSYTLQGENIAQLMQHNEFSLVVLDVVLPGKDGFYWLNWLHDNHPQVKVLMLSVKNQDDDRIHCLETGANDYLCKPFNPRELLARLNNLIRQDDDPQPKIIEFGEYSFNPSTLRLTKNGEDIKLTTTESKILNHLCQNAHITLTRDDLAQALRGDNHHPLDRSIDVHINRLRRKIEKDPSYPCYILTVWGKGYQFSTS